MKAGQYKIHSTNPIKILQSHAPQQSPPSKQFSSLFRFPLHTLSPMNGFSEQTFGLKLGSIHPHFWRSADVLGLIALEIRPNTEYSPSQ